MNTTLKPDDIPLMFLSRLHRQPGPVSLAIEKLYDELPDDIKLYLARKMAQFPDPTFDEICDSALEASKQSQLSTWADVANVIGPITWSWEKWLPNGLLTILAGEPGAGKSSLALRLAGCFLRGDPWPDESPFTGELGAIVWAESEAGQAMNLQRAQAWGLPIEKIHTPNGDPLADFCLTNQNDLDALSERANLPDVRMVIIDSLSGADARAEKSSEDAKSVKWLAELARDTGKPVMLTHHLRKRGMFDAETVNLERLRGSGAIVQPARMVWALDTPDPQVKTRKRISVVKSNLAPIPSPLGLSVTGAGVQFGPPPSKPKTESPIDKGIDLLRALLQGEPQSSDKIKDAFTEANISQATMYRARERLGIVTVDDKWSLPAWGSNGDD